MISTEIKSGMEHNDAELVLQNLTGSREAFGQIVEQYQSLIIFTSGYSAEIVKRGLALQPGERFIQKPCPPQELLEVLRRCLESEG
jgi:hypothetical protein